MNIIVLIAFGKMKTYNIISGYLKWLQEKSVEEIDSTKLRDFIKISDDNGIVEWHEILEKIEYEDERPYWNPDRTKEKKHFYRRSHFLKDVERTVHPEMFTGKLVNEKTGEIRNVNIFVKTIDLLEFLYSSKSHKDHEHQEIRWKRGESR